MSTREKSVLSMGATSLVVLYTVAAILFINRAKVDWVSFYLPPGATPIGEGMYIERIEAKP